jgi:ADP-ribosylglycohydrolase
MWGAVIGDIAGSIYERAQHRKVSPVVMVDLITPTSYYSDDTILTIAIYDAILNNADYGDALRAYGRKFMHYWPNSPNLAVQVPRGAFSQGFTSWVNGETDGKSMGNGAMMRISGVGKMFSSEKDVLENARLATIPSHNSQSAVECAQKVALTIFYARMGMTKEWIRRKLGFEVIEFRPFERFNRTCNETITNCMYALFESVNFEDAVRHVIGFGGDTDTNGAIVGAMAEALYGVPEYLVRQARKKIPKEFSQLLDLAYNAW